MTPIIWSPQAIDDVVGIQAYIRADSERYADLVVRRIVASVARAKAYTWPSRWSSRSLLFGPISRRRRREPWVCDGRRVELTTYEHKQTKGLLRG